MVSEAMAHPFVITSAYLPHWQCAMTSATQLRVRVLLRRQGFTTLLTRVAPISSRSELFLLILEVFY